MNNRAIAAAVAMLVAPWAASAETAATEDFEKGYSDGEPLRVHADWFYEDPNEDPTSDDAAGLKGSWGVGPGDRAFTWVAKPFCFSDSKLVSITLGGDWQTDAQGRLDDDRAGWSISDTDDSSDNIFGVQIDPGPGAATTQSQSGFSIFGTQVGGSSSQQQAELNIEAYWDGDSFGDDGGRTSIVKLPKLKPQTWYRLRAKFTKLSPTSVKIDVTFVELDDSGKPTGEVTKGAMPDTSQLSNTANNAVPNKAYFTTEKLWPVFKNYGEVEGGFDNAYFELELAKQSSSTGAASESPAEVTAEPDDAADTREETTPE